MTERRIGERLSAIEVAQKALEENAAMRSVIANLVMRIETLERRVAPMAKMATHCRRSIQRSGNRSKRRRRCSAFRNPGSENKK
jgi:hypothetical protein